MAKRKPNEKRAQLSFQRPDDLRLTEKELKFEEMIVSILNYNPLLTEKERREFDERYEREIRPLLNKESDGKA